jgi:hypothetical protein
MEAPLSDAGRRTTEWLRPRPLDVDDIRISRSADKTLVVLS